MYLQLFYLYICLSVCLSISLWLYSPFSWTLVAFSVSWSFTQSIVLLGRWTISPSQGVNAVQGNNSCLFTTKSILCEQSAGFLNIKSSPTCEWTSSESLTKIRRPVERERQNLLPISCTECILTRATFDKTIFYVHYKFPPTPVQ
jgi:hypothetical protein